jgi:hypothetical protein
VSVAENHRYLDGDAFLWSNGGRLNGLGIEDAQRSLERDDRFIPFVWRLKFMNAGPQRDKAIGKLWKQAFENYPPEDDRWIVQSFTINDLLQARDELHELSTPLERVDTSLWGYPWGHRSSADSDGPSSQGRSKVGTESATPPRS